MLVDLTDASCFVSFWFSFTRNFKRFTNDPHTCKPKTVQIAIQRQLYAHKLNVRLKQCLNTIRSIECMWLWLCLCTELRVVVTMLWHLFVFAVNLLNNFCYSIHNSFRHVCECGLCNGRQKSATTHNDENLPKTHCGKEKLTKPQFTDVMIRSYTLGSLLLCTPTLNRRTKHFTIEKKHLAVTVERFWFFQNTDRTQRKSFTREKREKKKKQVI